MGKHGLCQKNGTKRKLKVSPQKVNTPWKIRTTEDQSQTRNPTTASVGSQCKHYQLLTDRSGKKYSSWGTERGKGRNWFADRRGKGNGGVQERQNARRGKTQGNSLTNQGNCDW